TKSASLGPNGNKVQLVSRRDREEKNAMAYEKIVDLDTISKKNTMSNKATSLPASLNGNGVGTKGAGQGQGGSSGTSNKVNLQTNSTTSAVAEGTKRRGGADKEDPASVRGWEDGPPPARFAGGGDNKATAATGRAAESKTAAASGGTNSNALDHAQEQIKGSSTTTTVLKEDADIRSSSTNGADKVVKQAAPMAKLQHVPKSSAISKKETVA
ncbi:unnamed protein product, partial [Amoebophrya sp. A25]